MQSNSASISRSARRSRRQLQEAVEEVAGVVRARAGLGVVLDGAAGDVLEHQALDRAVVEVQVGELGGAEVGAPSAPARRPRSGSPPSGPADGEAVVLGGDVDPAGLEVLDRVVGAAVAEGELEGLEPDRPAEELVAEADADDRLLADDAADVVDDVVERRRVAGAVGEEDEVGVAREHLARRSCRRAAASAGSRARGTGG